MITPITKQRWQEAQIAERTQHTFSMEEGIEHYGNSYHWNFHFCGIQLNQEGKRIIEIGPADFPALYYCHNFHKGGSFVIEPMPSLFLQVLCKTIGVSIITKPVEEISPWVFPADEIWIFNVMQHIMDPDLFIEKCKRAAPVIRFFEPINYPTCVYHPHSYTREDFEKWFGDSVKLYTKEDFKPGFHDDDCVYGVWRKNIQS